VTWIPRAIGPRFCRMSCRLFQSQLSGPGKWFCLVIPVVPGLESMRVSGTKHMEALSPGGMRDAGREGPCVLGQVLGWTA
jgi:hypothetical protein